MSNDSSQSLDSPTNEAVMTRLLELENRTGYRMQQCNGQRRYWNPNWAGPSPPRGSEVFVGKIPRDLFEDEIVPVFEEVGKIYELRLMMDFSGFNRGYAFVTFSCKEEANRAIKMLDNFEIRPGLKIGVCRSVDNCRHFNEIENLSLFHVHSRILRGKYFTLFVGCIPKDKSKEEIRLAMCDITDDVSDVIIDPGNNPGELNRGYAYVEYASHRAAAMARRKLIPGRITLFGYEVAVDWADPESDIKSDVPVNSRNVIVQNLRHSTTEFSIWSAFNNLKPGSIEKVKKNQDQDFASVYFHRQEDATHAVKMMDGKFIDGQEVRVSHVKLDISAKKVGNKFCGRMDAVLPHLSDPYMRLPAPTAHIRNSMDRRPMSENPVSYYNGMQNMPPSFQMRPTQQRNAVGPTNSGSLHSDPCSPRPPDEKCGVLNEHNMLGPTGVYNRKLRPALTLDHIANIKCPVVTFGNRTYMPPISSETVEEAKKVAAQYVIDNIEPWLKSKLDTLVAKPPGLLACSGPLPQPRGYLCPDSGRQENGDNIAKMIDAAGRPDFSVPMRFHPQTCSDYTNVSQ